MFQVKTSIIKSMLAVAAKKDIRYYLNGLLINERHIVATDGHSLVAFAHEQEWGHGAVIVPREALEMAIKAKTPLLAIDADKVGAVSYTPIEGKFPDYMRVIPASVPASSPDVHCAINSDYLRNVNSFLQSVHDEKKKHYIMTMTESGSWAWKSSKACAVIMPLRVSKDDDAASLGCFE